MEEDSPGLEYNLNQTDGLGAVGYLMQDVALGRGVNCANGLCLRSTGAAAEGTVTMQIHSLPMGMMLDDLVREEPQLAPFIIRSIKGLPHGTISVQDAILLVEFIIAGHQALGNF